MDLRRVADFYDDPGMEWSLRSVGSHLHAGSEAATVALAGRAAGFGLATGGIIIDIASALGAPARLVARRFASTVVCIDMDRRMHTAAREAHRREGLRRMVQPLLARTERLPLANSSCDGAWSQDALCHMDKEAVLAEVARVLKPGALFAFTDFIGRPSITTADLALLRRLWAFPSLFTLPRYAAALDALGFEVLLAEDRTNTILLERTGSLVDDEIWWYEFTRRWGEDRANAQLEVGRAWQEMVQQQRAGYGMFIARRMQT